MPPVRIQVQESMLRLAQEQGRLAQIGGASSVFPDHEERMDRIAEDQVVGQLGQMALAIWKDGHLGAYHEQRSLANASPLKGDGGSDLVGANVDVKASLMRGSTDPMRYRLAVRPREMHGGWVYVLALVEPLMTAVSLVGWATSDDLASRGVEADGPFSGARCIPAGELRPLPPFDWEPRWD